VLERSGISNRAQVINSVKEVLFTPDYPGVVLERRTHPRTQIVSLTITEKGYFHDPATGRLNTAHPDIQKDWVHPKVPTTALGFLVKALRRRRAEGLSVFTVLCCDNLPQNGTLVRGLVLEYAAEVEPALRDWIAQQVAFPCTMVDRIVPKTTPADLAEVERRLGVCDEATVVCEPFRQWVIEDWFVSGRPEWDKVGAQLVSEVRPFELMKLRLLNGSHSALAYLGWLAGCTQVAEVIRQPNFVQYLRNLMAEEMAPTLEVPPGVDLLEYQAALSEHFANPAHRHGTGQITMDGSQKLPQRLLAPLRERLAVGEGHRRLTFAVAGWMRYVAGVDEHGAAFEVSGPFAEAFRQIAADSGLVDGTLLNPEQAEPYVRQLLGIQGILGTDLAERSAWVGEVTGRVRQLIQLGASEVVCRYA